MGPEDKLKVLDDERAELLTKADQNPDEWTDEDAARAETVIKSIKELRDSIAKRDAATAALRSAGMGRTSEKSHNEDGDVILKGGLGDRFVNSEAYKAFRAAHALPVDGMPVSVKASGLGGFVAKAVGDPEPISSGLGGAVDYTRLPGITDLTYAKKPTLLDFITRGSTTSAYLEYRQLIAVTSAAAVVPEKGLKPLSQLTTSMANAAAYTIADGIKVTNQELADDGVIASLLNSVLTRNIWLKVEDLLLNGTGTNEPKGILNASGILQEDFTTDLVTTIRKGITRLRQTSDTEVQVVILSPEDDEALDLLQDANRRYYGGGPFQSGPSTIWGRPRAVSSKVPVGTALMGDFSAVQLLEREGLSVQAFNQNEDDARRNLTYIRAELRELLLIREPAKMLVADVKGA